MSIFTSKERNAISEFRKLAEGEISNEILDDYVIHNFLKARNFNLKQAAIMLRKSLDFRKSMQLDTILTDYEVPEVLDQYVSQSFLGFDKEDCPIRYSAIGRLDSIGVFRSANRIDILKCVLHVIETDIKAMKLQSKKVGKQVTQCVFIYDCEKMTLAQATHKASIEQFLIGINIFQDNYPELLKTIYIINAAAYFSIVFPIIKTILSGAVIGKIRLFGRDGWKEELLKVIDADVLPASLGGTRTDPDGNPLCNTVINYAGKIPEIYYLEKRIENFAKRKGVININVDRQSRFEARIEVNEVGTILEWEFELTGYDIGFELLLEEEGGAHITEMLPMYKHTTEYEPTRGMFRCKRNGTYIIAFDNTYSWFYSKEVYYRVWLRNKDT